MKIKAVIWDLGGVLVRTEDGLPRQQLAERLKISRTELEQIVFGGASGKQAQKGEITSTQHWENIRKVFGIQVNEVKAFQEEFWGGDVVDYELIDHIRGLKRLSYTTGLLSNAFSDLREYVSMEWKIADAFDQMVISAEVRLMKPDERIYRLAINRLDVQPGEAVFIDDMLENVQGARAAGMHAIQFQSRTQALEDLDNMLNGRLS